VAINMTAFLSVYLLIVDCLPVAMAAARVIQSKWLPNGSNQWRLG
jgi:hypothetical protein